MAYQEYTITVPREATGVARSAPNGPSSGGVSTPEPTDQNDPLAPVPLTTGAQYYVRVFVFNEAERYGEPAVAAPVTEVPRGKPGTPPGAALHLNDASSFRVTWGAPPANGDPVSAHRVEVYTRSKAVLQTAAPVNDPATCGFFRCREVQVVTFTVARPAGSPAPGEFERDLNRNGAAARRTPSWTAPARWGTVPSTRNCPATARSSSSRSSAWRRQHRRRGDVPARV